MNPESQDPIPTSPEQLRMPASLRELADKYDYKMRDFSTELRDNIDIAWDKIPQEEINKIFNELDASNWQPHNEAIGKFEFPVAEGKNRRALVFEKDSSYSFRYRFLVRMSIIEEAMSMNVDSLKPRRLASLSFHTRENKGVEESNMTHRIVRRRLQKQAVASNMLRIMETAIKSRGTVLGKEEIITADIGQGQVPWWLLKNGFKPADPVNSYRIQRFLDGSHELMIADRPNSPESSFYIFEKYKYHDKSLDINNEKHSERYIHNSYRMKLVKKIL